MSSYKESRELFRSLNEEWEKDVRGHSNPHIIFTHPAYQRIIGMGPVALPYIFENMRSLRFEGQSGVLWDWALRALTRRDPDLTHNATSQEVADWWMNWLALNRNSFHGDHPLAQWLRDNPWESDK